MVSFIVWYPPAIFKKGGGGGGGGEGDSKNWNNGGEFEYFSINVRVSHNGGYL